jgi:hypothetical protein
MRLAAIVWLVNNTKITNTIRQGNVGKPQFLIQNTIKHLVESLSTQVYRSIAKVSGMLNLKGSVLLYWVIGLLGYWVIGLLGYWVIGLLGYSNINSEWLFNW